MNKVTAGQFRSEYATANDFCAVFEQDMDLLYSLAFLLTGDDNVAEQCFLAALEDCQQGSNIFLEWTRSWSRRAIIKQAIRIVNPAQIPQRAASYVAPDANVKLSDRLMQLPAFERFVFAMAVLERYSSQECAALLKCEPREVEQTRARVLQRIAITRRAFAPLPETTVEEINPNASNMSNLRAWNVVGMRA